ncbi:DUF4255 domain-containing protein [Streptomyces sp. NPDC050355]|uniref:DUF4255 domain-containing protein n=1 Tax=Streptomyces sp. NPDC050355 TaxID=3365609 RepID=UPI0037BD9B08
MSNALAVATVTQALALLIEHNLHPEIDMAVSVETRKPPADPPTDPTITVFLYQVTHNPSMRNNDLVTRASDGTLLKRPAAALDLHYVISAYGEETELVGQRLIGSVVRTLHEIPVLPHELIEEAVQRPYLAGSDLAESLQKVRFTPTQMDVDESSKLWGMLHNTPYSLSVVYQASLVLLDGHQKPKPAKPVERPEVTVLPFGAPGAPERPSTVGAVGASVPPRVVAAGSTASSDTASRAPAEAKGGVPSEGEKGAGARTGGTGAKTGGTGDEDSEAGQAGDAGAGGRARAGRTAGASTRAARKAAASVGGSRAAKRTQPKREARGKQEAPAEPDSSAKSDSSAKTPDSGSGSGSSPGSASGSGKEG